MALAQINLNQQDGHKVAVTPSKLVCIGRNYAEHIQELGNEIPDDMVVFLKPNSAISQTLNAFSQETIHYEAELCFMVKDGKFSAVGLGLDLTKRQLQGQLKAKGLPWERAKAFDGSAVFSEFTALEPSLPLSSLNWCFELTLDGERLQWGDSELMLYTPQQILTAISEFMTLEDGDIVMTGTPKGVGELKVGGEYRASLWDKSQVSQDMTQAQAIQTMLWQAS
ncbi:fumarylacetoacetate hydrolase family protein [Shewanella sp. SR44-3]|uniref:fumarylacetoacetate hydrolase family protein n=1 Tax=Shewanella sp. SR44-3 TaxID=2760936 RepID=UPI0015F7DDE9|nr:fumarylacetoacetate hydrolase family protein [Shewanella sp. SR44-3]MBB1268186.1 fumarylacetoacetate hydrolase family protein [Shewanella sp. SR44-3]